jgi:hypothetical protein
MFPTSLRESIIVNFLLGWGATVGAGLASYPIGTIRSRMLIPFSEKHSRSVDCAQKILAEEGIKSFFKGPAVSFSRGVTSAGVLTLYDWFQVITFGNKIRWQRMILASLILIKQLNQKMLAARRSISKLYPLLVVMVAAISMLGCLSCSAAKKAMKVVIIFDVSSIRS